MRVRIIKATSYKSWYADKIGEVIECYDNEDFPSISETHFFTYLKNNDDILLLRKADVELLNSDKNAKECDASEAKKIDEPLAQNNSVTEDDFMKWWKEQKEYPAGSKIWKWFKSHQINSEEALTECYVPTGDDSGHLQVCKWLPTLKQWIPIEGVKRIKLPSPAVGGMRWVKASDRFPVDGKPESLDDVTFRQISTKKPIESIWKFHKDVVELDNRNSICGEEISYTDVEWLEESASAAVKDDWKERVIKKREEDFKAASVAPNRFQYNELMENVNAINRVLEMF